MKLTNDVKIIVKLTKDTIEDKISWKTSQPHKPSSLLRNEELIGNVYWAEVLERKTQLYKFQFKSFYDEFNFEWFEDYRLEFIDSGGNSLWTFSTDRAIMGLYKAVQYKTANIDDFMSNYLNDENDKEATLDSDPDSPF